MADKCAKLIRDCITASCENPVFAGMEQTAYIFNFSETTVTIPEGGDPNIITDIVVEADTNGYQIQQLGKTPFTGTNTAMVEGNIANKFTETINFVVPDNSPLAANILDNVANGKFIVVVENLYEGSDKKGKFQVYGAKKGLVATAIERDAYSEDNDGGWAVTLTGENAPLSAMFFYKTDIATTRQTLKSLCPCV